MGLNDWIITLGMAFVILSFPLAGLGVFLFISAPSVAFSANALYFMVSWTILGYLFLDSSIRTVRFKRFFNAKREYRHGGSRGS